MCDVVKADRQCCPLMTQAQRPVQESKVTRRSVEKRQGERAQPTVCEEVGTLTERAIDLSFSLASTRSLNPSIST